MNLKRPDSLGAFQMAAIGAIDRGLAYLLNVQEADGHLPSYVAADLAIRQERRVDRTIFITQHIAASLLELEDERARQVVKRSITFLEAEIWPGGLWKFWTKDHPGRWAIPLDVDDTACVAHLMRCVGRPVPDNSRQVLLGNRTREGLFRTWILPHTGHLLRPRTWAAMAATLRHPLQLRAFFLQGLQTTGDLDAVVMANVVLFLGACQETEPTITWLHQVIAEGKESASDRYYQSPLPLYYAMVRCFLYDGSTFSSLKTTIVDRLLQQLQNYSNALSSLDLALICIVLQAWQPQCSELRPALTRLLEAQLADGSWPAAGFFFGACNQEHAWGSEALTTGFCLEALDHAAHEAKNEASMPSSRRMSASGQSQRSSNL